ncbi:hypothetical protein CQW23_27677 [Capsicum baccatum]|uniref:Uncharacterized protein n=1 Tax=Capsicum baccatum TaxID=33114 RepID=A0A2G2VEC8_CAPBA|nr:hypothetical protein CQW23_27677 [Capsicum baccatum]
MILILEAFKRSVSGSVFSSWEGGLMNDCFSSIDRGNRFLKKGKPPPIELSYAYDWHSRGHLQKGVYWGRSSQKDLLDWLFALGNKKFWSGRDNINHLTPIRRIRYGYLISPFVFSYDFAYYTCCCSIRNCILNLAAVGINLTPSPVPAYVYRIF